MKPRTKLLLISIGGLVLVVGALAGTKAAQIKTMIAAGKSFAPPPETVASTQVETSQWQPTLTAVGSVVAMRSVTIASELPGTVQRLHFESGKLVRAGEILIQLDTSIEEAQLASATAQASLAVINRDRAVSLRKLKANTQAELDTAIATAAQAEATVANIRATIAKKNLRAPFAGRLGLRQVEVGQVLAPGTPIVTLTAFDPIYVDFFLPQQALAQLEVGQTVRIDTDTFGARSWEGKISAIDSAVDLVNRNVKVRAQLANEDEKLRPGMFVSVAVLLPETKDVLTVAATAIIYAPFGDSVFVIEQEQDPEGKPQTVVHQKFVRIGERRGDLVAVESGLEGGETVVSAGAFKLRNGAAVVVDNTLAPEANVAPKPSDG